MIRKKLLDVLIMYVTLRLAKHLAKTFRCTLHFAKCAMLRKNFQKKKTGNADWETL